MNWQDFAPNDSGFDEFAREHELHPLHVEDCRSDEQQTKVEHGEGYVFVVLKLVVLKANDELSLADLDLFLGPDYLVTVHRTPVPVLAKSAGAAETLPTDELHAGRNTKGVAYIAPLGRAGCPTKRRVLCSGLGSCWLSSA